MMTIEIYSPLEVTDGIYNAKITDISEIASKKFTGSSKCLVKLEPYRGDRTYEEVLLWIGNKCSTNSVEFQFLQTLGVTGTKITVEELKENFLGSNIGLEIEDNEAKDGRIFHNIVSFFDADELEDDEEEDDDFDGEEDDSDDDEENLETESDSDVEGIEESGDGMDDFEELPKWNVTNSSRKNSGNNRRNRRRQQS